MAYSNLPLCQLDQIADFLEEVLNKPIRDILIRQKVDLLSDKFSGGSSAQRF